MDTELSEFTFRRLARRLSLSRKALVLNHNSFVSWLTKDASQVTSRSPESTDAFWELQPDALEYRSQGSEAE